MSTSLNPLRVAVALSGGVDSTVTALLLKRQGFDLIGIYMTNWLEDNVQMVCESDRNRQFARSVCLKLDIDFKEVSFVKTYWNNVFSYLLKSYRNGQTPNPDVMCNKFVKFGSFVDFCIDELKVDAVATGHYAATSYGHLWQDYCPEKSVRLLRPKDKVKDQTLFLSQISQKSLRKVMFPLQHCLKSEVKAMAKQNGFKEIAEKPESKGICFIGKRNFNKFIDQYIEPKFGRFVDIETGTTVGTHKGIHHWIVGQNCKLGGMKSKYFVVKREVQTNDILVTSDLNHYSLMSDRLVTEEPNWIRGQPRDLNEKQLFEYEFRFQHKDQPQTCRMRLNNGGLYVELDQKVRALNEGQFAVFYKRDECLGSAPIKHFWNSCQPLSVCHIININSCIS